MIQYFKHCSRCGRLMIPVLVSTNGTQWSCECGYVENDSTVRLEITTHTVVIAERKEE